MSSELLLLFSLLWPFFLVALLAFTGTRPLAQHLATWAALPALLLTPIIENSTTGLPWVLLGGLLRLDFSGRVFLILAGIFSLTAGLLGRVHLADTPSGIRFSRLLLLAIGALLWLSLAGDALLFFTASTVLGYSLYAMFFPGAAVARRIFVVLLVTGDLVVFELLLVLAHDAGGTSFEALRHGLLLSAYPATAFILLLVGFGIKLGLIGFHFWLAPSFVQATAPVRVLLLGFVFCAGMLGWLRLLPLGEVYWPDAGLLLQWLALATLGYAVIVGMLQAHYHSVLAYSMMTLSGLFLWLLGAVLAEPTLWTELFGPLQYALMQAGFGFAALSLLPNRDGPMAASRLQSSFRLAGWLATLLLVTMPLGIISSLAPFDPLIASRFTWIALAFALLPLRCLQQPCSVPITRGWLLALVILGLSGMFTAIHAFSLVTLETLGLPALLLLLTAVVGWRASGVLVTLLGPLPPGDLLGPIERAVRKAVAALYQLGDSHVARGFYGVTSLLGRLAKSLAWQRKARWLEAMLGRWSVAMSALVLFGLAMAWWAGWT